MVTPALVRQQLPPWVDPLLLPSCAAPHLLVIEPLLQWTPAAARRSQQMSAGPSLCSFLLLLSPSYPPPPSVFPLSAHVPPSFLLYGSPNAMDARALNHLSDRRRSRFLLQGDAKLRREPPGWRVPAPSPSPSPPSCEYRIYQTTIFWGVFFTGG